MKALAALLFLTATISPSFAWTEPDWSAGASVHGGEGRRNLYQLTSEELEETTHAGYLHALKWPVTVSGLYIPYQPLKTFLESDNQNPLRSLIARLAERQLGFYDLNGLYEWLGLTAFPDETQARTSGIPYPGGVKPSYRMGVSILDLPQGEAMTFACTTCHLGEFLGKPIMGLTNKRPRANEFFVMAKKYVPKVPSHFFKYATEATENERLMFKRTRDNLGSVGAVDPQVLGLDTSLPHVALSLAHRKDDAYATKSKLLERFPRRNALFHTPADSKPMPWWNLKYKTRWLSDGSIVEGNPILTNFLWNELGRGTDLHELEAWMKDNQQAIKNLTAAAFATKAPKWTDFFPADSIDIDSAKRGETVFNQSCKECHGSYVKGWSSADDNALSLEELLETTAVHYHEKTPIKDVGTDPHRYQATAHFAGALNKLAISKWMKTVVEPQKGYVPPPLVGVFARYPYLHNNAIPNLCALMERPDRRPRSFVQGPSKKLSDYDATCVGYPVGDRIPKEWLKESEAYFDVAKPGLSNQGHSKMFWNEDGSAKHSEGERRDLLEYLKTL
jgi:mono/diheme cytochrome c family protein